MVLSTQISKQALHLSQAPSVQQLEQVLVINELASENLHIETSVIMVFFFGFSFPWSTFNWQPSVYHTHRRSPPIALLRDGTNEAVSNRIRVRIK